MCCCCPKMLMECRDVKKITKTVNPKMFPDPCSNDKLIQLEENGDAVIQMTITGSVLKETHVFKNPKAREDVAAAQKAILENVRE